MVSRLMILISLPYEAVKGYGDLAHYYSLARMGRPFIDYWVEYPPIFPLFSSFVYQIAFHQEHVFIYFMALVFSLFQAGCLWIFLRLLNCLYGEESAGLRGLVYTFLSAGLVYGWWYFDSMVVFLMLSAIEFILGRKIVPSSVAIAVGALAKWFPILVLVMVWLDRSWRLALKVSVLVFVIISMVYGMFYLISPEFTKASLNSQIAKGSWETIWALIDGNLQTGNFGPLVQRYNPSYAYMATGFPSRIPPMVTLLFFGAVGLYLFGRIKSKKIMQEHFVSVSFLGLTWCLFLLWSPGYSPQWVMYLLPLVLLILPERRATLLAIIIVLVNLLEWPILLSRGYFNSLWFTIPLRTALTVFLALEFWKGLVGKQFIQEETI